MGVRWTPFSHDLPLKAVLNIASLTWQKPSSRRRLQSLQFLMQTEWVHPVCLPNASLISRRASPSFNFYSCNLDQMGPTVSADPRKYSIETSIVSLVGDAISFSHFLHVSQVFSETVVFAKLLHTTRLAMYFSQEKIWPRLHHIKNRHKECPSCIFWTM